MANFFVDTVLATGLNDGTSTDDAWRSIETAMESAGYTPGDKCWIKRDSLYTCAGAAADIALADTGTAAAPIYFIGWPRAAIPNTTITGADFTNGSNKIDNVAGITPKRTSHIGRYITAPDGKKYLITAVLWEASLDGTVAAFTLGSKLTNSTQTKYGKVWGWASPVIQYVRDPAAAWVENNALADAVTGTGDIDVGGETAVGFLIDREYAGSTVTGVNGKFQIEADNFYTEAQAIDDSAWTIKLSTWTDDADDLPLVDFNGQDSQLIISGDNYYWFENIEFQSSLDSQGIIQNGSLCYITVFRGCLVYQDQNKRTIMQDEGIVILDRCIVTGNSVGTGQNGVYNQRGGSIIKNSAIYGMGDSGLISAYTPIFLNIQNTNIGVEINNEDDDIECQRSTSPLPAIFKDIKLGGANGDILLLYHSPYTQIAIENYGKVLATHKKFMGQGTVTKVTAGAGGDIANQRSGGAANLIEIAFSQSSVNVQSPVELATPPIFTHEFEVSTASLSYRYYVQSMAILTAAQLWIEVEYVSGYDDTSEYVFSTQKSDETFTVRANADDWAEYMEVTGIAPAVASKVRIKGYCSYYHATNKIYIDPKVVIS